MSQTQISQQPISGMQISMALFATASLLLGLLMASEGNTSMTLTNFCGGLFFIFAYHNPTMLEDHGFMKTCISPDQVIQKKFLWASLAVGALALVWESNLHLPLG
jgi:hypothetical protein